MFLEEVSVPVFLKKYFGQYERRITHFTQRLKFWLIFSASSTHGIARSPVARKGDSASWSRSRVGFYSLDRRGGGRIEGAPARGRCNGELQGEMLFSVLQVRQGWCTMGYSGALPFVIVLFFCRFAEFAGIWFHAPYATSHCVINPGSATSAESPRFEVSRKKM